MKLEDQVCSLELAKRLKGLGVKQDGIHSWSRRWHDQPYVLDRGGSFETVDVEAWFSAFTVAELGEMLPLDSYTFKGPGNGQDEWFGHLADCSKTKKYYFEVLSNTINADTEADARAKMLIYLLENGPVKPSRNEEGKI